MNYIDTNNPDLRVQKTNRAIIHALAELMLEKKLTKITISELCQRAGINRKTFYMHFSSVDEAFDYILWVIEDRYEEIQLRNYTEQGYNLQGAISQMVEALNADLTYYTNLARGTRGKLLMLKCTEISVRRRMAHIICNEIDYDTVRRVQLFFNAGFIIEIYDWLKSDKKMTAAELIEFLHDIFLRMRYKYPIDIINNSLEKDKQNIKPSDTYNFEIKEESDNENRSIGCQN